LNLRFRLPTRVAHGVVLATGLALVAAGVAADARWFEDHWLSSYCTRSPVTEPLETALRVLAVCTGLVLATRARGHAVVFVAGLAERWATSLSVALSVAAALFASDLILRLHRGEPSVSTSPVLPPMTMDATGNIGPLASRTKDVRFGDRLVRYAINGEGNRAATEDDAIDPAAPSIVFAGESVGIGWGVPYEQSFPAQVARELGVQAVNLSVAGFANDQAYLRARDGLGKLASPIALVTVALSDQLERNVSPTRERLVLTHDGRLELAKPATSPLLRLIGYHASDAIPLTRAIFRATRDLARARGIPALFVWTNYGRPCTCTDDGVSPLEERLFSGIDVPRVRVDIAPDETIDWPRDAHPNENGHRTLARATLAALRGKSPADR
jgi:hypothetical protein